MDMFAKLKPSKVRRNLESTNRDHAADSVEVASPAAGDDKISYHFPKFPGRVEAVNNSPISTPTSLSHSYSLEWENLFNKPLMLPALKERAMTGNLRSCRFRSIAWKIFLEVLPPDRSLWIERTQQSQNNYEELRDFLIVNPRKAVDAVDITLNNPLSQDEESPWNKFFQDNELRLTIKQDVIRTHPKIEFFQSNQLRNLMVDILFVYAKENPDISYRQGMHELLAPLIFVLHCDHQAFLHASEMDNKLNVMKEVLDPAFLEHDAYTMFCQVMTTVEPWYLSRDVFYPQTKTGSTKSLEHINAVPFSKSQDLNPSSVIVTKLTRIQDRILKRVDPELHQHLERLEIVPQIYGIRWLRLLFGREFPMQDLLMLWDAIFGDGIGFGLVDYIFVAMLLYLRDILLTNDYTVCLTVLMKFPPVADVHYFVAKALWIREPNVYPQPPNYTHQGSIRVSGSMISSTDNVSNDGSAQDLRKPQYQHGQSHKKQNMLGGFSSFSRKFSRPRTLSVPKSSSEPMNLQTDMSPDFVDNPVGSTVSLSQVEESMFRHNQLASSLAQLEGSNLRSAQSSPGLHHSTMFLLTPDEVGPNGSLPTYNSLPGRSTNQQKTKTERELQDTVSQLERDLSNKNSMCRYCSSKLDVHIIRLQQDLSRQNVKVDEDIMLSLAGLKLVRDILNGTIPFSQDIATDDDGVLYNDDYSGSQNGGGDNFNSGLTSPETDISLSAAIYENNMQRASQQSGSQRASQQSGSQRASQQSGSGATSPSDIQPPDARTGNVAVRARGNNKAEIHDFSLPNENSNIVKASCVTNNGAGERRAPVDKSAGSVPSQSKEQPSSSNLTSKFMRMFKTDTYSNSQSRSGTKTAVQQKLLPAVAAQQKLLPAGVAPTSRLPDSGQYGGVYIPTSGQCGGATTPGNNDHQLSRNDTWEREMTTLDSNTRARCYVDD